MQKTNTFNENEYTVLSTLAYYEALSNMPLTSVEIQRYCMNKQGVLHEKRLFEIRNTLDVLVRRGLIVKNRGLYALSSNEYGLRQRPFHVKYTALKWKRFRKRGWFLPYIPHIRSVGMMGSVATSNAHRKSDIDILVGTSRGKLWSARMSVTILTQLIGIRRHGRRIQDRLCFNQYMSQTTAQIGAPGIATSQISAQYLSLWDSNDKYSSILNLGTNRVLLGLKRSFEIILTITALGGAMEKILSILQINKIHSNKNGYPAELPTLSQSSSNVIFYYPKVVETEAHYHELMRSFL